jgi:hypothetical protein
MLPTPVDPRTLSEKALKRFDSAIKSALERGDLEPKVFTCTHCGGSLVVTPIPLPVNRRGDYFLFTKNECEICQVDRVERWGDLMRASAAMGNELRSDDPTAPIPIAKACEAAGLVRYVNNDKAWELTEKGYALLNGDQP